MTVIKTGLAATALALAMGIVSAPQAQAAEANLDCTMRFSLTGWSAIYKHAEGTGVVTCENGQSMRVKIEAKGAGLTVGKAHIDDGKGEFTEAIGALPDPGPGKHASGSVAAGKSATAQVLTKGNVSLALAGTGEGVNLGISFGGFTISKAK